jgi:hypothetical protein
VFCSFRFEIRIQTNTNLSTQVALTIQEGDIVRSSFISNRWRQSQMFSLFSAAKLPNVTFVPQTDRGFMLMLQPPAGERFQVSAGSYRLSLELMMAEVGASVHASTAASGYVRVELLDLISAEPLDPDWFASDAVTGLAQDASGKWLARVRGSSKPLANAMSFAAMRISFVYVMAQVSNVFRRSSHSVTIVASPSATVSVGYTLLGAGFARLREFLQGHWSRGKAVGWLV